MPYASGMNVCHLISVRCSMACPGSDTDKTARGWKLFLLGSEGKKRPVHDLIVPDFIDEKELGSYLADICHEWANDANPEVYRINGSE